MCGTGPSSGGVPWENTHGCSDIPEACPVLNTYRRNTVSNYPHKLKHFEQSSLAFLKLSAVATSKYSHTRWPNSCFLAIERADVRTTPYWRPQDAWTFQPVLERSECTSDTKLHPSTSIGRRPRPGSAQGYRSVRPARWPMQASSHWLTCTEHMISNSRAFRGLAPKASPSSTR